MHQFICDPDTELTGQTVLSLITNINYRNIETIVARHHLSQVNPEAWYPLQDVLNVLRDISAATGSTFNFVSIGMAAAQLAYIPPEMEHFSVEQILQQYSKIYKMRHRGGNAGAVQVESISPTHLKIIMDTPYPDDIMYGVMYGYARRFLPDGTPIIVRYDENHLRMSHGGQSTILHVMWE